MLRQARHYHIIISLCAPLRNHQQTVGRLFAGSGANCAARALEHWLSVLTNADRQTDGQMDGCDGKQTTKLPLQLTTTDLRCSTVHQTIYQSQ